MRPLRIRPQGAGHDAGWRDHGARVRGPGRGRRTRGRGLDGRHAGGRSAGGVVWFVCLPASPATSSIAHQPSSSGWAAARVALPSGSWCRRPRRSLCQPYRTRSTRPWSSPTPSVCTPSKRSASSRATRSWSWARAPSDSPVSPGPRCVEPRDHGRRSQRGPAKREQLRSAPPTTWPMPWPRNRGL